MVSMPLMLVGLVCIQRCACCFGQEVPLVEIVSLISRSTKIPQSLYSIPVLDVGVRALQNRYSDRFNFTHVVLEDSSADNCEDHAAVSDFLLARWYYTQRSQGALAVFIWPGCLESSNVRLLAASWNVLYITSAGRDDLIRDRAASPTWISTGIASLPGFARFSVGLMERYRWTSVFLVLDRSPRTTPFYAASATAFIKLSSSFKHHRLTVREVYTDDSYSFEPVLQEFRTVSRVMFFYGHAPVLRSLLITAARLNMANGDYVYVGSELQKSKITGNFTWNYGDAFDELAQKAFASLLILERSNRVGVDGILPGLARQFHDLSETKYNFSYPLVDQPLEAMLPAYAALALYGQVVNESSSAELGDGRRLAARFVNRTFRTDTGDVYIDPYGQRLFDLVATSYLPETGNRQPFLYLSAASMYINQSRDLDWHGKWNELPPNEPECGYSGRSGSCALGTMGAIYAGSITGSSISLFLLVLGIYLARRRCIYFWYADVLWWQLLEDKLEFHRSSSTAFTRLHLRPVPMSQRHTTGPGSYNGRRVWISAMGTSSEDLEYVKKRLFSGNKLNRVMRQIRLLAHPNINKLVGISVFNREDCHVVAVSEYAPRGSMHDLMDRRVVLDLELRNSLVCDFCEGLNYLHKSSIGLHGNLVGSKCLIDKHFLLRISDAGYSSIRSALQGTTYCIAEVSPELHCWAAPEVLRGSPPTNASEIFSAGVILFELYTFMYPYEDLDLPIRDLRKKLAHGDLNVLTGSTGLHSMSDSVYMALQTCFYLDASSRPSASMLTQTLLTASASVHSDGGMRKGNLIDKILMRLEKYAQELEGVVLAKTNELIKERAQCDVLLRQILPRTIVEQLRAFGSAVTEYFEAVTVLFSDLYGLDMFIAEKSVLELAKLLELVESQLDWMTSAFEVYKVEVIADTFLIISGAPVRIDGNRHAQEISSLALVMTRNFQSLLRSRRMELRIGIHSGPCAAGVVGCCRPRYCVFGDTVNTASRMNSHGLPNKIQISQATATLLKLHYAESFTVEPRGVVDVKNKSPMLTYWLEWSVREILPERKRTCLAVLEE